VDNYEHYVENLDKCADEKLQVEEGIKETLKQLKTLKKKLEHN
jgi:hypothetical protein